MNRTLPSFTGPRRLLTAATHTAEAHIAGVLVAGALLAGVLLAGACSSAATEVAPSTDTTAGSEATTAPATTGPTTTGPTTTAATTGPATTGPTTTGPVGIDVAAVTAELTAAVEAWQLDNGAPGVSFSIRLPDTEPIAIATGVRDLLTEEAVSTDDYFRIASITKPMTSAVVLQLVDEGLVELDAPVTTYLGDDWLGSYPYAADITVAQLLNHTNGMIEYAFDVGFYVEAAARQDVAFEPEEILEFLSRQEPLFAPGTQYQYETGGFVAAGLIIEAVTGNSAAAEMRSRVFEPAGAANIYLTPEEFPPDEVVHAYARAELYDALTLLPGVEDELGLTVNDGEPVVDILSGEQAVLQSAGWTGGGNEAQLESVSAIFKAMFDGTVLSPEAIESFTTTALDTDYGLGLDVKDIDGTVVYQHGGGVPGFRSQAGYLPDYDVAYAFSASLIPLPDGGGVGELQRAVLDIVLPLLEA